MVGRTGLSGAINLAAFAENDLGMVVLGIGCPPDPNANPTLIVWWNPLATICSIQSRSSEQVSILPAPLDGDGVLETIVRFNDTADDWATLQVWLPRWNATRSRTYAAVRSWLWPWLRQLDYRVTAGQKVLWKAFTRMCSGGRLKTANPASTGMRG